MAKDIPDNQNDDALENDQDLSLENGSDNSGKPGKIHRGVQWFLGKISAMKKVVLLVVMAVLLLAVIGLGTWFFFFKGEAKPGGDAPGTNSSKDSGEETLVKTDLIIFEDIVDLEPFEHIQLKESSDMGFISINLSLELTDPLYRKQIYTLEDRIRKIVTDQLKEAIWLDLRNPEGKILLKYTLLGRINSIFPKARIRNIYFTYFIMQ